jgi:hypothetical protein
MQAGTFKALSNVRLMIWPASWANQYRDNYEAALAKQPQPHTVQLPLDITIKEGQEFTVEFGAERRKLLEVIRITKNQEHHEDERDINVVDVIVKVGSKTHTGICIVYDECLPVIVQDANAIRPVKKRAK